MALQHLTGAIALLNLVAAHWGLGVGFAFIAIAVVGIVAGMRDLTRTLETLGE